MGGGSAFCYGPRRWWDCRTTMEKTLISFSTILIITFVIVLLEEVTIYGNSSKRDGEHDSEENWHDSFCKTENCLITAGKTLEMLNSTILPCENFYEFACGGYLSTHAAPLDFPEASVEHTASDAVNLRLKQWLESEEGNYENTYRNAKVLYSTCMERERQEEMYVRILKKVIQDEKIGNWPLLDPHWYDSDSDATFEQRLATLTLLGIPVGYKIEIVPDPKQPEKYVVKLLPGEPLLKAHEEHEIRDNPILKSYIETVLLLLGVSKTQVAGEVEEVLATEAIFIRIKKKADIECGHVNGGGINNEWGTERMLFTEMDRRIPEVNWTQLMTNIFNGTNTSEAKDLMNVKEADVFCRRHIREYVSFLQQLAPKVIYNYLGWRFLFTFLQHLGPPFYRLHSDYQSHIVKETHRHLYQSRWKECVSLVEHYMLPILAKVYRDNDVSGTILKEKKKISSHVRSSLTELLSSTNWLKEQDREKIKQKVATSKFDIALMKISSDWEKVHEWFADLSLHASDHLIENVLKIQRFEVTNQLKRIIDPSREMLQWENLTLSTPVTTTFQENSIPVHFDKMRSPYLRVPGPSYLNYGSLGSYLSRQLIEYISSLNFSTTVDTKRINVFWEVAKQNKDLGACSHDDMLGVFAFAVLDHQENDELMNSVLTELSALQVSHLAYDNHYSEDRRLPGLEYTRQQMFFLAYAQSHCEVRDEIYNEMTGPLASASIRVNVALRNFPPFGNAFDCPADSPMNPSSKCHILN